LTLGISTKTFTLIKLTSFEVPLTNYLCQSEKLSLIVYHRKTLMEIIELHVCNLMENIELSDVLIDRLFILSLTVLHFQRDYHPLVHATIAPLTILKHTIKFPIRCIFQRSFTMDGYKIHIHWRWFTYNLIIFPLWQYLKFLYRYVLYKKWNHAILFCFISCISRRISDHNHLPFIIDHDSLLFIIFQFFSSSLRERRISSILKCILLILSFEIVVFNKYQ
jgi:hypothetical protein